MKETEKSKTPLAKIRALFHFINSMAYVIGLEMTDWHFNYRSLFTLTVILFTMWLWFYSAYVEYNTLKLIELIAGLQLILTVINSYKQISTLFIDYF